MITTRKSMLLTFLLVFLALFLVLQSTQGNDSYLRKNSTFAEYNASDLITFTVEGPSVRETEYEKETRRIDKIKSEIEVDLDIEDFDQIRLKVAPLVGDAASGSLNIKQISNIYDYMCSNSNWGYLNDPRGLDWFQNATYTLRTADSNHKVGYGDCDDFAILMASFIENIGGATTVVLASDPGGSGHVYAEVFMGKLSTNEQKINSIIEWLRKKYHNQDIGYDIPNPMSEEVWLNLDYNSLCPGGPPIKMAKNIPLVLREGVGKRALMSWNESLAKTLPSIPDLPQKESEYKLNYSLREATALREAEEDEEAIKGYEEIIKTTSPIEYPYEYGSALDGIGVAYKHLASKNEKERYLLRAINSYKEALDIRTIERFPIDYAKTQNNLGVAYSSLGWVRNKESNLMLAITAFQEALKIRTIQSYPIDYAQTQNDLGNSYSLLAEVRDEEDNIMLAMRAYQEALKIRTVESYPLDYAKTQTVLGYAYVDLSEVRDEEANLKLALKAFQEALKIQTVESYPIDYATTQIYMGLAYFHLAQVRDKVRDKESNLMLAIAAYQEALKIRTAESYPIDHAGIMIDLGNAYSVLAQVRDNESNLMLAIGDYQEALKVYTIESYPIYYATINNNLGNTYKDLANFRDKEANIKLAIAAYEESLRIRTIVSYPIDYAMTQNNLGLAYMRLSSVQDIEANLKLSIAAYEESLKIRTIEDPNNYAMTQYNLGIAYWNLAGVRDKEFNLKLAITAYQKALKIRTIESCPVDYARTQGNIGRAYEDLAAVRDKESNLKLAIQAYEEALKVFPAEDYPEYNSMIMENLTDVKNRLNATILENLIDFRQGPGWGDWHDYSKTMHPNTDHIFNPKSITNDRYASLGINA